MTEKRTRTWRLATGFAMVFATLVSGSLLKADEPADILGTPEKVAIEPANVALSGRRATAQVILTGHYSDGSLRDLTRAVEWVSLNPEIATISPKGQILPVADGEATIVARQGSIEARTTVKVSKTQEPDPVSFRHDVIPAFSQAGCNMGACHGTPTGKGGFRLSLRGYLPDQDFQILSREAGGRRINPLAADTSLLLSKPLGEVPHEGGLRLDSRYQDPRIPSRLDRRGRQGRPDRPGGHEAGDSTRQSRPERPGQDAAGRCPGSLRRRHNPRRHPHLLLRLLESRDRHG